MSGGRKVAILQTAFLGDTLLSIPLVKALHEHEVSIHDTLLICRRGLGDFFRQLNLFGEVLEVDKGDADSYHEAMRDLEIWWSSASTRILLSPHTSLRSWLWAANLRLRGQFRSAGGWRKDVITVGFESQPFGMKSALYSQSVVRPAELPEALRQMALLRAGVFSSSKLWAERLEKFRIEQGDGKGGISTDGELLQVPDWASMSLKRFELLMRDELRVAIAPGSVWKTKQWTKEGFAKVGSEAVLRGFSVDLLGTKEERSLCAEILEQIKVHLSDVGSSSSRRSLNVVNHAGQRSLFETAEILARSRMAFVNDSGAMHLAALSGVPIVSFFGPTVLDFGYRPWSKNATVLQTTENLKCRPCGKHGGQSCPIGTHECMTSINAQHAIQLLPA